MGTTLKRKEIFSRVELYEMGWDLLLTGYTLEGKFGLASHAAYACTGIS